MKPKIPVSALPQSLQIVMHELHAYFLYNNIDKGRRLTYTADAVSVYCTRNKSVILFEPVGVTQIKISVLLLRTINVHDLSNDMVPYCGEVVDMEPFSLRRKIWDIVGTYLPYESTDHLSPIEKRNLRMCSPTKLAPDELGYYIIRRAKSVEGQSNLYELLLQTDKKNAKPVLITIPCRYLPTEGMYFIFNGANDMSHRIFSALGIDNIFEIMN